jgi:hypothetical protein
VRGALLAKGGGFKKLPEDIRIKQEIDAENDPKPLKN